MPATKIRIPALGPDWVYPVLDGITDDNLNRGIAHYSETAALGQPGNYALAGHRSSVSGFHPWADLPDVIATGDVVILSTDAVVYDYVVDGTKQTVPEDVGVLAPDQERHADPARQLITLTTCTPRYGSSGRFIVFGHLADQHPRHPGPQRFE